MDSKPSLSQYFGDGRAPPASQFFDEIATAPTDMIQSVNLGENNSVAPPAENLFPSDLTAFAQQAQPSELAFSGIVPTVSASSALPATNLPDPSTFFDTIGPETQIAPGKSAPAISSDFLANSLDGLSVKEPQLDSEADRRRDAWLPNEEARKTLMKAQSSPTGSFFPEREVLTMPGLLLEEELADSLQEVAVKYLGVGEAASRGVLRQEHVNRDEAGLRELIRTGYFRAAINLTGTLITAYGQGVGRAGRPTKHTARSMQLWLTRFALMARVRLHDVLAREAEAFGDLSKPDLYYQFYPESHGSRSGSMVPFSLRLLIAELPSYSGKPDEAMNRLYVMLDIIRQMLSTLREGKTEEGTAETLEQDKMESLRLWTGREIRVLHSVVNCAITLKDYQLAIKTMSALSQYPNTSVGQRRALASALCRLCLHCGHARAAQRYLDEARVLRQQICPTPDVREFVDLGLLEVAQGKYQEAYNNFAKAADQEPTNIMVANNSSVCLLYMGKLKEAIAVLQKAINSDPERGLNESLLINLCTLYELESSKTNEKKLNLLRMLCKYKSDTIPNVMECLKLV